METTNTATRVTIETTVNAPVEKVWKAWTDPDHITKWNFASDDWHSPWAKSDLREGGNFSARMEAKDGSMGFDFGGVFNVIKTNEYIETTLGDGRKVETTFISQDNQTKVVEIFEAENIHPVEFQKAGWQAILDNFKKYAESIASN
jgi:uncharacterized protein YndB with AHSA1/START domain